MTLHEFVMTALNHPLQMLCIGLLVGRGVQAAVVAVQERRRVRLGLSGLRRSPTAPRGGVIDETRIGLRTHSTTADGERSARSDPHAGRRAPLRTRILAAGLH